MATMNDKSLAEKLRAWWQSSEPRLIDEAKNDFDALVDQVEALTQYYEDALNAIETDGMHLRDDRACIEALEGALRKVKMHADILEPGHGRAVILNIARDALNLEDTE